MLMPSLWLLFFLSLYGSGTITFNLIVVTATTDTTTPVVDDDNVCSICTNDQILTKSDTIIPSGTINFISNDISCIQAQIQSIQWTMEQCTLVHTTTTTSTICGCTNTPNNIDISLFTILDQCTSICRKGESITNPNTIIPSGTINFLSSQSNDYTCQQAQNDIESNKWTNDQCIMMKQQTNVPSICGCTINSRPLLRGGISIAFDTTTLPSSGNMRRRRSHNNNSTADDNSTGSNIFD